MRERKRGARYALLVSGLCAMALGVSLSIQARLGTSPISSVPYVTSLASGLSVGTTTILMNSVFVLLQILLLRGKYRPFQLMQLPVTMLFGGMIDVFLFFLRGVVPESYAAAWALCVLGIVVLSAGVSMCVTANIVTAAGEGIVLAVCEVSRMKFGTMKVCFDSLLVMLAVAFSLLFLGGVEGVREGTVASAFCVGMLAKRFSRFTEKWI